MYNQFPIYFELLKQVSDAQADLSQICFDLNDLHQIVSGLVSFHFVKLFIYMFLQFGLNRLQHAHMNVC